MVQGGIFDRGCQTRERIVDWQGGTMGGHGEWQTFKVLTTS